MDTKIDETHLILLKKYGSASQQEQATTILKSLNENSQQPQYIQKDAGLNIKPGWEYPSLLSLTLDVQSKTKALDSDSRKRILAHVSKQFNGI
jgi:hypothetical protein